MGMATKAKTGRKRIHHRDSQDTTINGLSKMKDGRWRIIGTHIRFTEADERLAIAKFRRMTQSDPSRDAIFMPQTEPERYGTENAKHIRSLQLSMNAALVDPASLWAHVRKEIIERPLWVAEQVGIEQIGYLLDLPKPEPLPTFDELKKVWTTYAKCATNQRQKVVRAWDDFVETTGIENLRAITPQLVVSYQDDVYARELSGKQQQHMFGGIRRVLSFARERALAVDTINQCLGYLKILKPSETSTVLDPKPIEVGDWQKLHAASVGEDRAMILICLNAAMYLGEAIRLEWSDIVEGCISTRREKTGKCVRVCVLWPETIEAVRAVERKGDRIFLNYRKEPLRICGAMRRFSALADTAKVPHVTASQLRDGAYTAAVQANVTTALCQLLVGHRSGMADHYVLRNPQMVKPATEAIRAHYLL